MGRGNKMQQWRRCEVCFLEVFTIAYRLGRRSVNVVKHGISHDSYFLFFARDKRYGKIFPDYPTAYLWAYPCGNILMDGEILSNAGFHKTPKWLQKAFLKWAFYFNRCVEEKNDKKYLWEKHYQVGKKLTTKLSALYPDIVFRYSAPYEYEARRTELIIFNKNDQEGGK